MNTLFPEVPQVSAERTASVLENASQNAHSVIEISPILSQVNVNPETFVPSSPIFPQVNPEAVASASPILSQVAPIASPSGAAPSLPVGNSPVLSQVNVTPETFSTPIRETSNLPGNFNE